MPVMQYEKLMRLASNTVLVTEWLARRERATSFCARAALLRASRGRSTPRYTVRRSAAIVLAALFLSCLSEAGLAEAFVPARLIELEGARDLECPDNDRESSVLFCQVIVDHLGEVANESGTFCVGNSRFDSRRARILRNRIVRSKFDPAQIDDEAVSVHLSLRAGYQQDGDECNVVVVPNLGYQQDEFGLDYIEPQEVLTDGGWLERMRRKERGLLFLTGIRRERSSRVMFVMSVAVDENGVASDSRLDVNEFSTRPDEQARAARELQYSQFVPGFVDEKPASARHYFLFYYPYE